MWNKNDLVGILARYLIAENKKVKESHQAVNNIWR